VKINRHVCTTNLLQTKKLVSKSEVRFLLLLGNGTRVRAIDLLGQERGLPWVKVLEKCL
jgi:hypothetical protein